MTEKPEFIDNLDGNTMASALRDLLGISSDDAFVTESVDQIDEARIASAYFSPEGFARIAPAIGKIASIKLLLGTDPIADHERWKRKLDESEERFVARRLREKIKVQEEALRSDLNFLWSESKTFRTPFKAKLE